MKLPLRIAILMCDSPLYKTAEKYGNYGGVFSELLKASAESLKDAVPGLSSISGLEISKWDVDKAQNYPALENIDAILITGSRKLVLNSHWLISMSDAIKYLGANAYDSVPWVLKLVDYVQRVLEQDRVRIVGVCFGHQILGRALELLVGPNDLGWELAVTPISLTPTGQRLLKNGLIPKAMSLQQIHRDIVKVDALPEGIENLGYTDTCKIQGMYKRGRFISVQGHPEFTPGIVRELLDKRLEMGIFTKEMYAESIARVENQHDGIAVGAAFLRFLLED